MKLPNFETWMGDAQCAQTDPELFFPEKGGKPASAKRICETCPVKTDCLEYALEHQESGVWAGTTENDRRKIRRQRAQQAA